MTSFPAHLRSALTLVGLVVLLLAGVAWAWAAVTEPFPEREKAAVCTASVIAEGEKVYPDQVTVSVLNAGDSEGLADRTMSDLVESGLDRGVVGNAPADTEVNVAQIWTEDPGNPAVLLVKSFLGKQAKIVRRDPPLPGVNVVVGEEFTGAKQGRKSVKAREESSICSPTVDDPI